MKIWISIVCLLISLQYDVAFSSAGNGQIEVREKAAARCESVFSISESTKSISLDEDLRLLRASYVREVNLLGSVRVILKKNGANEEAIARTLHNMRRELGVKYKNLTPVENRNIIYARNIEKYGDKLGPTVDWLREQGHSWEEIAESATRTGGKDLGL